MRLAVLCGWWNAQHRAVQRFAPIYKRKGYETICAGMPPSVGGIKPIGDRETGKIVAEMDGYARKSDHNSQEQMDVVLHLFSGACNVFLPQMVAAAVQLNTPWKIRAIVHDSGPTMFGILPIQGATHLLVAQGYMNQPTRQIVLAGTKVLDLLTGESRRKTALKALSSPPTAVPQLFLYSRGDNIVHWSLIEQRLEEQRKRGVPVEAHVWEDSEHVRHYGDHPAEYERLVRQFLDKHVHSAGS